MLIFPLPVSKYATLGPGLFLWIHSSLRIALMYLVFRSKRVNGERVEVKLKQNFPVYLPHTIYAYEIFIWMLYHSIFCILDHIIYIKRCPKCKTDTSPKALGGRDNRQIINFADSDGTMKIFKTGPSVEGLWGKLAQVRVHGRFLKNNQTRGWEASHSETRRQFIPEEKLQEQKPRGGEQHDVFLGTGGKLTLS